MDYAPAVKTLLGKRVYGVKEEFVPFGESHDWHYVSVYEMPMQENHLSEWNALASGDKTRMDAAFRTLLRDMHAREYVRV